MFTGIIEEVGLVHAVRREGTSGQMTVTAGKVLEGIRIGDSICTDGVCLTVTNIQTKSFTLEIMPETFRRTTLGNLKPGDPVNLERALRLSDRLGGHIVSGHIDGTGQLLDRHPEENAVWLKVSAGTEMLKYIVEKGSVAIDGISLTVVNVDHHSFTVSIIPHTQEHTSILRKGINSRVNIECDLIAKYIEKLMKPGERTQITLESLARNGYI